MSVLEILTKLHDGQMELEEAIKLLKLSSKEEEIKILTMVKDQKVTPEDGKELLEAINTNQAENIKALNPGKGRIRGLGIFTLAFGAFLFLSSILVIPVMFFFHSPITGFYKEENQKNNLEKELQQHLQEGLQGEVIPGPLGNTAKFDLKKLDPKKTDDFDKRMAESSQVPRRLLLFLALFLGILSISMMIYAVGLILITGWGRKMGLAISIFSTTISSLFTGFGIYKLVSKFGNDWGPLVTIITCSVLVFIFSLISIIMLKSNKTTETIQREIEIRNSARSKRTNFSGNRFFRSRTNKMLLGICGGLAEYFNIDPMLTRVGTVLLAVVTVAFPVALIYIVCGFIIPQEPEQA